MKEWRPEELKEQHGNRNLPVPAQVRHKKAMKASFAIKRGMNKARERVQEHNQAFVSSMRYEIAHAAWVLGSLFRVGVFLFITAVGIGYFFMIVANDPTGGSKTLLFLPYWIGKIAEKFHLASLHIWDSPVLIPIIVVTIFCLGLISPFLFIAPFLIVPAIIYRFLFPRENTRLVHFFPEYWIMKAAVGDAVEDLIREKIEGRKN